MVQITWKSLMTGTSGDGEDQIIEMIQVEQAHNPTAEIHEPTDPIIPRRKDRDRWPSLFVECQYMLSSSVLMYALTDLRNQIRKGKIVDPSIAEPFMRLPALTEELVPIVMKNKPFFERLLGEEHNDLLDDGHTYLDLLLSSRELDMGGRTLPPDARVLLEMHDENNHKEMVYAISLNQ
jgi:hypothetical protein